MGLGEVATNFSFVHVETRAIPGAEDGAYGKNKMMAPDGREDLGQVGMIEHAMEGG